MEKIEDRKMAGLVYVERGRENDAIGNGTRKDSAGE